jgi:hypothetical protein
MQNNHQWTQYGMPSDASSVLRIDIETDEVTTFGHVESTSDKLDSDGDALPEKNKWQVSSVIFKSVNCRWNVTNFLAKGWGTRKRWIYLCSPI